MSRTSKIIARRNDELEL